jgi:hypothetical protein
MPTMGTDFVPLFIFFFIIVFIIVIIAAVRSFSRAGVQRPMTEVTAFPPPPPPDTVLVKCQYCGTEQTWRETCVKCGAPIPKPKIP